MAVNQSKKITPARGIRLLFPILLIFIFMAGCHSADKSAGEPAFSFDIPGGFSIADISENECSIQDSSGAAIGGFIITDLKAKSIKDTGSISVAQYLNQLHEGCEYFSWMGNSSRHPAQYITQYVQNSDEKAEYYRVLFERNAVVYDMWFDVAQVSQDTISEFVSKVVEQ